VNLIGDKKATKKPSFPKNLKAFQNPTASELAEFNQLIKLDQFYINNQ
jgi:hypothetical protein